MTNEEKEIGKFNAKLSFLISETAGMESGDTKTTVCPLCGNQLTISKSSYNGHIHAYCRGGDFSIIQ